MAKWVDCSGNNIPDNAVRGGHEADGTPLYVAMAFHAESNEWIPGKVAAHLPGCHIPWGGEEKIIENYKILVHDSSVPGLLTWKKFKDGKCPCNTFHGEPDELIVARAKHEGGVHPGKLHKSHNCCYISYGGQEIAIDKYWVLYNCYNAD